MNLAFNRPHEEAAAIIRGKPAVARRVFDQLLPEIKARAFTISGIEGANTLQRVRDEIAALAIGGADNTWDDVKGRVADNLLGAGFDEESAQSRSELLIRTHGFQAFEAANYNAGMADGDTTHFQYMSMEDDKVRDAHAALNGLVLPKNDPFWETHTPPWDWGCRCHIRPINPDLLDLERAQDVGRNPEDRNVIEGPAAEQLRNGTLIRDGRRYDVSAPSGDGAFQSTPGSLKIPLDVLQQRYDPEVWAEFAGFAAKTEVAPGKTVADWLGMRGGKAESGKQKAETPKPKGQSPNSETQKKVDAPDPEIRKQVAAKLKSFAPEIQNAVAALPKEYDRFLATANFKKVRGGAKYFPGQKLVQVNGDASHWGGTPQSAHHELGHHIHFETNTITHGKIAPEWRAAFEADHAALAGWLKANVGEDWKQKLSPRATLFDMAGAIGVPIKQMREGVEVSAPLAVQKQASLLLDSIQAMTRAGYGMGHGSAYFRDEAKRHMEVFAHACSVANDPHGAAAPKFAGMFPNCLKEFKRIVGL